MGDLNENFWDCWSEKLVTMAPILDAKGAVHCVWKNGLNLKLVYPQTPGNVCALVEVLLSDRNFLTCINVFKIVQKKSVFCMSRGSVPSLNSFFSSSFHEICRNNVGKRFFYADDLTIPNI